MKSFIIFSNSQQVTKRLLQLYLLVFHKKILARIKSYVQLYVCFKSFVRYFNLYFSKQTIYNLKPKYLRILIIKFFLVLYLSISYLYVFQNVIIQFQYFYSLITCVFSYTILLFLTYSFKKWKKLFTIHKSIMSRHSYEVNT